MPDVDAQIRDKVKSCLAKALGLEEDEIKADSSFTKDLGAESIDFLDIIFRIEQAFNIKIPRGDLFPENFLSTSQYVQNGAVTADGLTFLKKQFPFTDYSEFEKNPKVQSLTDTFTVKSLVGYLKSRLPSDQVNV